MHPYTTDSNENKYIPFYIAGLSILVAWLFNRILEALQFTLPWWFDAPSAIGFNGLFYTIFNNYLWRWQFLRTIRIVKVPNLNGTWKGYLTSSFDEHTAKLDANITILQKWSEISIILETTYSKSHSLIAAIITENPTEAILNYEYLNEPMPNAMSTMHTHRGTARLIIQANGKKFKGDYYSGRDRQNFGSFIFERI